MTGSVHQGRRVTLAIEPLAPSAGAAAFLLAFLSRIPSSPRRTRVRLHRFVKEPIENQANRHFQT
jgi:hypothetical protein